MEFFVFDRAIFFGDDLLADNESIDRHAQSMSKKFDPEHLTCRGFEFVKIRIVRISKSTAYHARNLDHLWRFRRFAILLRFHLDRE